MSVALALRVKALTSMTVALGWRPDLDDCGLGLGWRP